MAAGDRHATRIAAKANSIAAAEVRALIEAVEGNANMLALKLAHRLTCAIEATLVPAIERGPLGIARVLICAENWL